MKNSDNLKLAIANLKKHFPSVDFSVNESSLIIRDETARDHIAYCFESCAVVTKNGVIEFDKQWALELL